MSSSPSPAKTTPQERIKRYVAQTKIDPILRTRYDMDVREADDIYSIGHDDPFKLISLAFEFGMAKGYRAAKAEVKGGINKWQALNPGRTKTD